MLCFSSVFCCCFFCRSLTGMMHYFLTMPRCQFCGCKAERYWSAEALHRCVAITPCKINVLHLLQYATVSKGAKEVNASGKTFTVRSSLQLHVDRNDDGVAYTCKVDHVALTQTPQQATEVLEVHCECTHTLTHADKHVPQARMWSIYGDIREK